MRWERNQKQNLTHLLCSSCGSNFDGCQEHARYFNCLQWQTAWGDRAWPGGQSPLAMIVQPVAPIVTAADINPPQIDARHSQ